MMIKQAAAALFTGALALSGASAFADAGPNAPLCNVTDVSPNATACDGFYAGNLLNVKSSPVQSDVFGTLTYAKGSSNINPIYSVNPDGTQGPSTGKYNLGGTYTDLLIGIHFGGQTDYTAFYSISGPTSTITITDAWASKSSGLHIYSGIPAVPEASTTAMFAAGLGVLALVGSRRRRQG